MTQTPAGWYPDPEVASQQRYWDGVQWTEHRAPVQPTYEPPSFADPGKPGPAYQQPGQQPGQQPAYGQAAYQAYAPANQSHTARNVLIVIGVLFVLLVGGCFAVVGLAAKGVNDAVDTASAPHDVTYRVTGTAASAAVTYSGDTASEDSHQTVSLPFEKKVTVAGSFFTFYSISASGVGSGTVTCEILVDGASVDTETSTTDFGFVLCDHTE